MRTDKIAKIANRLSKNAGYKVITTTVIRGRSTTAHDMLSLSSPISNPSVWGRWGSGWRHSIARP